MKVLEGEVADRDRDVYIGNDNSRSAIRCLRGAPRALTGEPGEDPRVCSRIRYRRLLAFFDHLLDVIGDRCLVVGRSNSLDISVLPDQVSGPGEEAREIKQHAFRIDGGLAQVRDRSETYQYFVGRVSISCFSSLGPPVLTFAEAMSISSAITRVDLICRRNHRVSKRNISKLLLSGLIPDSNLV